MNKRHRTEEELQAIVDEIMNARWLPGESAVGFPLTARGVRPSAHNGREKVVLTVPKTGYGDDRVAIATRVAEEIRRRHNKSLPTDGPGPGSRTSQGRGDL
jgi:hypothetical protein